MRLQSLLTSVLAVGAATSVAGAGIVVDYTTDAGGANLEPLKGLAARATFNVTGNAFTILLENTSQGVPTGFEAADSLLVSLGMNLPGVDILSGDAAVIGHGSTGISAWSALGEGDSVGNEWLWTNDFGGDLMAAYAHVISTSNGQGGKTMRFDGMPGAVGGPFGGIAVAPPIVSIPDSQHAVSDSILFSLTLTGTLTQAQLQTVAHTSIVEFGSDQRYLTTAPEPNTVALLATAGALFIRRRRR